MTELPQTWVCSCCERRPLAWDTLPWLVEWSLWSDPVYTCPECWPKRKKARLDFTGRAG